MGASLKPVKRAPELRQLSRDHHGALNAALKLRRAEPDTSAAALEHFHDFWSGHGERHFEIEEAVLLPGFVAAGGNAHDDLVTRVLTDHVEIRATARGLGTDTEIADLRELGERLAAHVRLEEDELFPLIERTLDPDSLARLGEELEQAEAS